MDSRLRAFISYSTKDKAIAAQVKIALDELQIDSSLPMRISLFSEVLEERILEELRRRILYAVLVEILGFRLDISRGRTCC